MPKSKPLEYSEPDALTPEEIRRKLLSMDRASRIEFMRLTVEPPDGANVPFRNSSRKRRRRRPPLAA